MESSDRVTRNKQKAHHWSEYDSAYPEGKSKAVRHRKSMRKNKNYAI
ncbi:hypothetical protein [Aliikangiella sp. G2MR2-5]|nr:hypothetical protein [Aliikangiella sp. G2MR2-5]